MTDSINELKKSTLASYIGKATKDLYSAGHARGTESMLSASSQRPPEEREKEFGKVLKRIRTVSKAAHLLANKNESILELIKSINDSDTIESNRLMNTILIEKVSEKIEAKKKEVGKGICRSCSKDF